MNKFFKKLIPNKVLSNFGYTGIRPKSFFAQNIDIKEDIATKYGYNGPLLDIFASNQGPLVHKWHHYIPLYDRYLETYRNQPIKFLEIGVAEGGSLHMWLCCHQLVMHLAVVFLSVVMLTHDHYDCDDGGYDHIHFASLPMLSIVIEKIVANSTWACLMGLLGPLG